MSTPKDRGWILTQIILCTMASLILTCARSEPPKATANHGSLRIEESDLAGDSAIPLDGRWGFHYNEFLDPSGWAERLEPAQQKDDTATAAEPDTQSQFRTVPGAWVRSNYLDPALPADGIASYALAIHLDEASQQLDLSVRLPTIGTSYRFYVNGRLLAKLGDPDSSESTMTDALRPRVVRIPGEILKSQNEILVQVGNRGHREAGLWSSPELGRTEVLEKREDRSLALSLFLTGGLILIGIYHLGLYFARRKESAPLFFALFCITVAMWSAQSGQKIFSRLIDDLSGHAGILIEYLALYLSVGSFLQFASRIYPDDMPLWPRRTLATLAAVFTLSGLVLPLELFVHTLRPMQVIMLAAVALCVYWTFQIVRHRRLGAVSMGLSLVVLTLTVTNDLLVAMSLMPGSYLAPYGLMAFIIGQSFALSMRLSNAFNELEDLSRNLETRVQKRTDELDSLNELTRIVNESQDLDYIVGSTSRYMIEQMGMRRMFLFLVDPITNEIHGNGGQIEDLSDEERRFFQDLRAPIEPDLGTIYRTIKKKKSVYLDFRKTGDPAATIDRMVVEQLKMKGVVEIPAIVGEEVLGVATIDPGDRRLKREEILRLEAVVAQISGAVQKQLLLQKIEAEKQEAQELKALAEREKEESELLAELARETNRGATIEELLEPVARVSHERLGTSSLALYLEDDSRHLVLRAGFFRDKVDDPTSYPELVQRIPLDAKGSSLPRVHLRKRSSFIPRVNPNLLRNFDIDYALYEFWHYEWVALLPLVLKDQSIGLIAWSGPASDRISRKDLPLLERVADTITGAIENLNLLERIREEQLAAERERRNSQTLAALSKRAIEGEDLNAIVEAMHDPISEMVGRLGIAVYLPDARRQNLEARCILGMNGIVPPQALPELIQSFPLKKDSGSMYLSFKRTRSWYMPEIVRATVERSEIDRTIHDYFGFCWCYHIPLLVNDEVIGIVSLAGLEPISLSLEDRALLERIVAQAAGAIRMQQLLQSIEQERNVAGQLQRESRALSDFTRLLNQRADLKSIVQEVCRFAVESLNLRGSYIMIVNESDREFQSIGGYGKDYGDPQALFVQGSRMAINTDAGIHYSTYQRKKTTYLPRIPAGAGQTNGFLAELFDLKSFALVPLLLDDRVIGIMGVDPGQQKLSKKDLRKLESYADQVAGAINNGNLLKQVEEQRSSIEGLAEITRMATTTDNLDEILDQIFGYVYRRFGIASGVVLLPDSEGDNLICYKAFSLEDMDKLDLWDSFEYAKGMRLEIGDAGGTLARTFLRGKPFYVANAARLSGASQDYPGADKDREILSNLKYRGYFALPMHANAEPVALLVFTAYTEAFKLTPRDREELKTLADQLAGIIRSRQLASSLAQQTEQVQREKADSQVLANLSRQANEGSDIASILKEMAAYADSECGVKRLGLWLLDQETGHVRLHSVLHSGEIVDINDAPEEIRALPAGKKGGSVVSVVERNRKMFLPYIKDSFLNESPIDKKIHQYFEFDWLLHLPLNMEGSVLGVINFVGQTGHRPGVRDRLLLERMTAQVAGAIQSKQLLAEVRDERADSEALAEVARRANEETSISEIIEVAVKYSSEKCGADTLGLVMLNPDRKSLSLEAVVRSGKRDDPKNFPEILHKPPLRPETGSLYHAFTHGKSIYFPRISPNMQRRLSDIDRAIYEYLGFDWCMDVPVVVHGQVLGVLAFAGPERDTLSARQKSFLERLTAQVAGAIHGKRLLDQVEEEKNTARRLQKETEGLNLLLKRIAPIEDLEEIMDHVLVYLSETYNITLYSLYSVDHEAQLMHPLSVRFPDHFSDEDRRYIEENPVPFGEGANGAFAFAYHRSPKYTYFKNSRLKARGIPEIERFVIEKYDLDEMLMFPLMDGDKMAALLNLTTRERVTFSKEQLSQLSILSESLSGIIRMNGLIRDVKEQSKRAEEAKKETDILANLARMANESEDLKNVSQTLFDHLRNSMGLDDFCLWIVDQERSEVYAAAWDTPYQLGESEDWLRTASLKLEPDLGTLYRTYQKKKTTYIPRFVEGFSSPGDLLIVEKLKLSSVLQVPLIINDEVIGFFVCGPRRTLRLSREEIRTIERYCNQVAGAVRATALLDTSRRAQLQAETAREETEALARLSRQANETTDLTTLSQGVFDVLRESLGLDNQGLFVVDDHETELIPVHLDQNTGKEWDQTFRVPLNQEGGTLYKTWKRRKTTYLPRLPLEGASEPDLYIVRELGINAVLQIPLIVTDRVVAIFACGPTRPLTREEIKSAERYCQQIAGAVRVMALLQATQEAREEAVASKEEAEVARAESDALLENVLPTRVARELKEAGHVEPVYYDSVSVLFTDFVGFTTAASKMSPAELIQELDGCFSQFDEVSRRNNMEKLKTIGDAYMCAGGLPVPDDGHAIDACLTALEFRRFMVQMAEVKGQLGFDFWQIRIGIHSGPVTAGVIGQNKFAYDIWGDTVNVASRMESSGAAGMVNISGATYELVKDLFECEYRGKVQAKGKGEMDMYFVHRIRPELSADEEGLLPNAMFEMARTNLDLEDINELKQEMSGGLSSGSPGENGKATRTAKDSGMLSDNKSAEPSEGDRRQSGRRTGSERRKQAGARPLSEIDMEREGW